MELHFTKYQGTGNDFILLDNRDGRYSSLTTKQVELLCHRRFGIGADGLMLVENVEGYDFKMVYYNSDGNISSMCGNGGRCIFAFAKQIGIIKNEGTFLAVDGKHIATIDDHNFVELQMIDVDAINAFENDFYLNTGSPHYVKFVTNLDTLDCFAEGRKIRHSTTFAEKGINVNFLEIKENILHVRTYERGVEDETYSCGTGVVASSLVAANLFFKDKSEINVSTKGGDLKVSFDKISDKEFKNIWLKGLATKVFEGVVCV